MNFQGYAATPFQLLADGHAGSYGWEDQRSGNYIRFSGVDLTEVNESIPGSVPMITLNLAGYEAGHAPSGTKTRIAVGGFNESVEATALLFGGRAAFAAAGAVNDAPFVSPVADF